MEAFARKDRALVYLSRGVLTEAEDEIRRAHEIFQSCSDGDCHLEGLAHVNRVLGMLYRMQAQSDECAAKLSPPTANFDVLEKYQESEHLLRTALISFDRQGERAEAARTQLEIARTRARSKPRRLITDALLNALESAETCRRDLLVQEIEEELRQVDEVEYYRHIHLRARGRNASAETWSLSTGTREPMTVMFLDVQGSTEFASNHDPEVVMMLLNQMMAEFAAVMETHQATITAYLGDGFMALFRGTDHARHGVTAALELLIALKEFNQPRKVLGLKSINVRIGLSSGEVFIGNVGTYHKMDYTAIGTTANLAARLQSAAKPSLPCISRETYEQVRQRFIFQSDQPRIVKAKGLENQEAWDVVGEKEEPQ
jgi:class 3 adenylate cyclase